MKICYCWCRLRRRQCTWWWRTVISKPNSVGGYDDPQWLLEKSFPKVSSSKLLIYLVKDAQKHRRKNIMLLLLAGVDNLLLTLFYLWFSFFSSVANVASCCLLFFPSLAKYFKIVLKIASMENVLFNYKLTNRI